MRAILAIAALLVAMPAHADPAKFFLVLTVVMPEHIPDVQRRFPADSLDECWDDAKAAVQRGVPKQLADAGAIAVMAGCLSVHVAEADL